MSMTWPTRVLEIDEIQHFNRFRAKTLLHYMTDVPVAFDKQRFLCASRDKSRLEGGGFAKPRPPLFPGRDGRHRQRAFRDALADILPIDHCYAPTLRIAYFEVEGWILGRDGEDRMRTLIGDRLNTSL